MIVSFVCSCVSTFCVGFVFRGYLDAKAYKRSTLKSLSDATAAAQETLELVRGRLGGD